MEEGVELAKYAINQEGALQLKTLSNNILLCANSVIEDGHRLMSLVSSVSDRLGIYEEEILTLIGKQNQILSVNRDDILELANSIASRSEDVLQLISLELSESQGISENSFCGNRYASSEETPKTFTRDKNEAIAAGMRAIDAQMEAVRDDLHDKGITDQTYINAIVASKRESAEIEFYNDLFGTVEENSLASLQRLSSYFTEIGWSSLSISERQDALNTLAIDAGNAYRTEIKGCVFFDGPPNERGYFNGDGYLYINSDCLTDSNNRLDAIDTIYHEGRHAFQHAAIANPTKYGITSEQAKIWQDNFNHYLSSSKFGYERYYSQPVESDAFGFADYVIKNGGIS